MTSFKNKINQVGLQANEQSKILDNVSTKQKNEAILAMAGHSLNDNKLNEAKNKKD